MAPVTPPAPTGGGTSQLSIETSKLIWWRGKVGNDQRDMRLQSQLKRIQDYPRLTPLRFVPFLRQPVDLVRCTRKQQTPKQGKNNAQLALQDMRWIDHNES